MVVKKEELGVEVATDLSKSWPVELCPVVDRESKGGGIEKKGQVFDSCGYYGL